MRFLFVKTHLGWPRYNGHDVHSYYMMRALVDAGHEVALLTHSTPSADALSGLHLVDCSVLPDTNFHIVESDVHSNQSVSRSWRTMRSWRQEKFRSYWGIEKHHIRFTRDHAEKLHVDAVVVVGMEVLPYLTEIRNQQRIWYAADEWVWHHLSLIEISTPRTWAHLKSAIFMGAYEQSFSNVLDRSWVVSAADKRVLRMVTGGATVNVIANGVDALAYSPAQVPIEPLTCTFWGNLSFIPNEQALVWFCHKVWPLILQDNPDAQFNIYGFNPSETVKQLSKLTGVHITPNVPDIKTAVSKQAIVVLPFQSGGGVKNKLLEAAAMAKPIVCSTRTCNGLNAVDELPFKVVDAQPEAWACALSELWADPEICKTMGAKARQWVMAHHSWDAAARTAVKAMSDSDYS